VTHRRVAGASVIAIRINYNN